EGAGREGDSLRQRERVQGTAQGRWDKREAHSRDTQGLGHRQRGAGRKRRDKRREQADREHQGRVGGLYHHHADQRRKHLQSPGKQQRRRNDKGRHLQKG